ncbi:hypothetical protein DPSP01_006796 [Paraphaeosphaeria sporulosa]
MRFLLPFFAVVTVACAAVVRRVLGTAGDVEVSNGLSGTLSAAPPVVILREAIPDPADVEESLNSARDDKDVVKLFVKKGTKGQYYRYTKRDTDDYICMNYQRLVREEILSIRQEVPPRKKGHVRCEYYADTDCGTAFGKMTHEDEWAQGDLSKEPRKAPGEDPILGDWADRIRSVQCFWIRAAARRAEESGSLTPISVRDNTDVVELHTKLGNKGRYYYYSAGSTDDYICMNFKLKKGDSILSVRQRRFPNHSNVRCEYYAEADCGAAQGQLTRTGDWEQADLEAEFRKTGDIVLGSWKDQIKSVQCFWVRSTVRSTEETGSPLEFANAHDDVSDTSDVRALVDDTPITKDLELRDALNDDNVLTRLYDAENFIGRQLAHATQKDAEREYCIKTNLEKGVFIRSIRQNKDSEDSWFVCWYYDDDHCNSDWNPHGVFDPIYLERDASIQFNFAYKIMSFKCRYSDPSKRAAGSG